jgi:hypothetical protein
MSGHRPHGGQGGERNAGRQRREKSAASARWATTLSHATLLL